MATPIGHGLAGYGIAALVGRAGVRGGHLLAVLGTVAAVGPDLDFLPGIVRGTPALYHHDISHSVGFAVAAGLLAATLFRFKGWSAGRVFLLVFLAYCSHLVLDLVGPDGRPPYGIPVFWPVSSQYWISPVPILMGVRHAPTAATGTLDWIRGIVGWHNALALGLEMALLAPMVLLGRRRTRQSRS